MGLFLSLMWLVCYRVWLSTSCQGKIYSNEVKKEATLQKLSELRTGSQSFGDLSIFSDSTMHDQDPKPAEAVELDAWWIWKDLLIFWNSQGEWQLSSIFVWSAEAGNRSIIIQHEGRQWRFSVFGPEWWHNYYIRFGSLMIVLADIPPVSTPFTLGSTSAWIWLEEHDRNSKRYGSLLRESSHGGPWHITIHSDHLRPPLLLRHRQNLDCPQKTS